MMGDLIDNFSQRNLLQPLNDLDSGDLKYLFSKSTLQQLEPRTLITREDLLLTYLLEGEVSLLSGGFVTETFTHLQPRALTPLFNEMLEEDSAVMTSHGCILQVDKKLFEGLYSQPQAAMMETSQLDLTQAENQLFNSLLKAFMHKKLALPALPEAALKIRQAVNNPSVGSKEIIQIVQSDPVLSARLVRVANSPLYGTWREIKTLHDAVRRLGLETTKNLSFSLSVKQLFSARTSLIKKKVQEIYNESTSIAAIAYAITQSQATRLDPEQALLSGLIQNLGLIPILKYIDAHPSMMQTEAMLGSTIEHLQLPVTTLIFNEWNFDPEFLDIVEFAQSWDRDSGETIDYCDVIIAARLLYLQERDESPVEDLTKVPAIKKLRLMEFDEDGHFFMDLASEQIEEMNRLLRTA